MIVYLIRNTANGKCYVGKTSRPLWHRWSQHKAEARLGRKDTPLYKAMREFGVGLFDIEELATCSDQRRLCQLERKFIRIFDATNSGYNCDDLSRRCRIRFHSSAGYKITPEHRAKINQSNAARRAVNRKAA